MSLANAVEAGERPAHPRRHGGSDEADAAGGAPTRRCAITRAVRPREELIRFVIGPDGTVIPDPGARLPGRGIWLSARRDILDKACAKNAFARAAKTQARVPPGLPESIEPLLASRCLRVIELARRAGEAVGGFERVHEWLRTGRARLVLVAADGSAGSKAKLRGMAQGRRVIEVLDAAELGSAFGRDHVVNAAVAGGGLARRLETEIFRLSGFRSAGEGK